MKNLKEIGILAATAVAVTCADAQTPKKVTYIKDKAVLEKQLKTIAATPYKGKLAFGAMCYEKAYTPFVDFDRVCNLCGKVTRITEKTSYLIPPSDVLRVAYQIKAAGYDVIIDIREFCPHCTPDLNNKYPEVIFSIRFSPNDKYHTVKSNVEFEYMILLAFLRGEKIVFWSNGDEDALHDNIETIRKMTGLGADLKMPKKDGK